MRAIKLLGYSVSEELYTYEDALTGGYTLSRCPVRRSRMYTDETARRCLNYAKRIIEQIRSVAKDP